MSSTGSAVTKQSINGNNCKEFWEGQDAAKLGAIAASTTDALSIAQCLITAMVSE